jgi:hypothetical protein
MKLLEMLNDFFMSIIQFFVSIFTFNNKENKQNNNLNPNFIMQELRLGGKKKRRNKK